MVSACTLGYSYYAVTEGVNEVLSTNKRMLGIIAIGSISTFFIFWSLSGLILKIVKSNKKFYYKGLNSFTVRQISSKINTTVFSMTVICLMLFITICVLSSALSMKNSLNRSIDGKEYLPRYDKCVDGFYEMASNKINDGFIVLPDSAFVNSKKTFEFLVADYNGETDKIEEMVNDLINRDYYKNTNLTINTKADIRDSSVGLGAIVTFIGLYLGIIFLISCAAILALKELSESSDNFIRFEMLRKIGVDEKDLNKALFRQIGIFFMFSLLIAIIHSIFGIRFSNYILKASGVGFDLNSIIMTAVFIVIIYGGYFVVTYFRSNNIIREKN